MAALLRKDFAMIVDLSLPLAYNDNTAPRYGHSGTHFDVMDKEFPLEYTETEGILFDVSAVVNRDIDISDIDLEAVKPAAAVLFYTGCLARCGYGTEEYIHNHIQLSWELISALVERQAALIGIDAVGIRTGSDHVLADQLCADQDCFVVENIDNLDKIISWPVIKISTYPLNAIGLTGIPCRMVARNGKEEF